jgi:transcriptional antiterminator RfaH
MADTLHPWIVVNTHPHKEATATAHLRKQGFETYCPLVRRRVRHARKTREVLRPLFPGYLFVAGSDEIFRMRPVRSTVGVRAIVNAGDEPARLDGRFIAALRSREREGVISLPASPYEPGQTIRITDGPFDGTVATIIALDEKDRLVVLMDILSRPVRVHLDARQISSL